MVDSNTRRAEKAGSWYKADAEKLASELEKNLAKVPDQLDGQKLPIYGARIIIAPHAGYDYSGPCAAWAYKTLDLSNAKRVFILGPSHTYYLVGCALTTFSKYATPFGDLVVDGRTIAALRQTGRFADIPPRKDQAEHSIEMHLPYLWKRLEQTFGPDSAAYPPVVPVLVGNGYITNEREYGRLLAPYLAEKTSALVVSSDFCHWGSNFDYMPHFSRTTLECVLGQPDPDPAMWERHRSRVPQAGDHDVNDATVGHPIHETIRMVDDLARDLIAEGDHARYWNQLTKSGNTVCGRHPIGIALAALEMLKAGGRLGRGQGTFRFIQYQRSNLVERSFDMSVSYVSAYAVL